MNGFKYFHLIFHTTKSNRQSTFVRLNNSGEIEQTRIVCPLSDVGGERKKNKIDRREKGAKMRIVQQRTKSLERVLCVCVVWDTQTNLRVAVLAHL
jgi:hypothetical protein